MKKVLWFACVMASLSVEAAESFQFFPQGGGSFNGAAGNVVFDGNKFVAPAVDVSGALRLLWFSTNSVPLSNFSLSITGQSPRIAKGDSAYLLGWIDTNGVTAALKFAVWSNGLLGAVNAVAADVAAESVSVTPQGSGFMAVWETGAKVVLARTLDRDGAPQASAFGVTTSTNPQAFPSIGTDGTEHLICWMEQDSVSSDWRVMARKLTEGSLSGDPIVVSQTNSFRPYPTACEFGTNYLVAWSSDHAFPYLGPFGLTNDWFPAVHGRMWADGPAGDEFLITANAMWNTNIAVVFGGDRYMTVCPNPNSYQFAQPLKGSGERENTMFVAYLPGTLSGRIAYGQGRFCVLYNGDGGTSTSVGLYPQSISPPQITLVERRFLGLSAISDSGLVEVSTNLVNWQQIPANQLFLQTAKPRLFVRAVQSRWDCVANMQMIFWAKHRWAFDNVRDIFDCPAENDLFGAGKYLPAKPTCPANGAYSVNCVGFKPFCSISAHTL